VDLADELGTDSADVEDLGYLDLPFEGFHEVPWGKKTLLVDADIDQCDLMVIVLPVLAREAVRPPKFEKEYNLTMPSVSLTTSLDLGFEFADERNTLAEVAVILVDEALTCAVLVKPPFMGPFSTDIRAIELVEGIDLYL